MTLQATTGKVWWVQEIPGKAILATLANDGDMVEKWLDHQLELEADATCKIDIDNKKKDYPLELSTDNKGIVTCKMLKLPKDKDSRTGTAWRCIVPKPQVSGKTGLNYVLYRFCTTNSKKPPGHAGAKKQKLLVRVGKKN